MEEEINSTNNQNEMNELIALSVSNATKLREQHFEKLLKSEKFVASLSPEQITAIKSGQFNLANLFNVPQTLPSK
ncbi:hypothetical protein [Iningainema tapete]|uniref:Uncharacterized protein n=1 Tax=Iningainema tapete BLCC-T55 TaxID=2748662 RepID=A0A8J6XPN8_9CYAN|nr:hypothetical protein [Iningainema tapete]MBD2774172.1 hypothetical protein [Iningainema tapete BLCC-T55]